MASARSFLEGEHPMGVTAHIEALLEHVTRSNQNQNINGLRLPRNSLLTGSEVIPCDPDDLEKNLHLNHLSGRIDNMESCMHEMVSALNLMHCDSKNMNKELKTHDKELTEISDLLKKKQLIFCNVRLDRTRNAKTVEDQIINFIKRYISHECSEADIESANIIAQQKNGNYRVAVVFERMKNRNLTFVKRANLAKNAQIYVKQDLHEKTIQATRKLNRISKAANARGIPSSVSLNKITINSVTYNLENLDKLPHSYSLEVLSEVRTTSTLAFDSEDHYLSNHFPCKLYIFNKDFLSSEQAYQWAKASYYGNLLVRTKIENARTAIAAQEYGNELPPSKSWDDVKIEAMTEIVTAKFTQNPSLARKLINTPELEFVRPC